MRVEVLNGVNLDVLGRRDPALYGDLSLQELETRIYAWGSELDLRVRCRQTNHEGEYVDWLHELIDLAEGVAAKRVVGKGPDGYREALEFLAAQS